MTSPIAPDPILQVSNEIQNPAQTQSLPYCSMVQAVITAIQAVDNTFTAFIGGDTSSVVSGLKMLTSFQPTVGDTVLCLKQGTDIFGIGKVAVGTFTAYGQAQNFCTGTTVVGAFTGNTNFVNLNSSPNSVAVTKRFSTSNLLVNLSVTGWGDVTTGQIMETAVNIGGTDYIIGAANARSFTGNSFVSGTVTAVGSTVIPSLAAGSVTATIRVRNLVTTGNIHVDTSDFYSLTVQEML